MDLSDASALGEKGDVLAAFKKHRFHREIVNCQLLLHSARPKIKIVYTAPKLQVCTKSATYIYCQRYAHKPSKPSAEGFD